jgi:hypothetical protein
MIDFAEAITMTPERYLYLQFAKSLHHGYVHNATLNPEPSCELVAVLCEGERYVVSVEDKEKRRLHFTDRRLLAQQGSSVIVLFDYVAVRKVHWMDKDNWSRMDKRTFFDRLQVELDATGAGIVTLEGLDQAYLPIFQFLKWLPHATA